jgi:flagellar operon protein (TIGR03826 family)
VITVELRNCPECGKVFAYTVKNLCPRCAAAEEADYRKVKKYLSDHQGADLEEVHAATEVSIERILKFLRDGRLVEAGARWKALQCDSCGEPIAAGRYCQRCAERLAQQMQSAVGGQHLSPDDPGARNREKMYIIDRVTKKDR